MACTHYKSYHFPADLTLKYLIRVINLFKEKVSAVSHNPKSTILPSISTLALKFSSIVGI
uniref:Uncharacterized protein n=1 Tax=Solanum tuberosum TaxID=4113 RepID=M0ZQE3_SOLTU